MTSAIFSLSHTHLWEYSSQAIGFHPEQSSFTCLGVRVRVFRETCIQCKIRPWSYSSRATCIPSNPCLGEYSSRAISVYGLGLGCLGEHLSSVIFGPSPIHPVFIPLILDSTCSGVRVRVFRQTFIHCQFRSKPFSSLGVHP